MTCLKIALSITIYIGYFYKKICHQELSKIAKSGHTVTRYLETSFKSGDGTTRKYLFCKIAFSDWLLNQLKFYEKGPPVHSAISCTTKGNWDPSYGLVDPSLPAISRNECCQKKKTEFWSFFQYIFVVVVTFFAPKFRSNKSWSKLGKSHKILINGMFPLAFWSRDIFALCDFRFITNLVLIV